MPNTRTLILAETALAVALAAVLNLLALRMPINIAGGSVSLTMLPIALVALRRGPVAGLAAGTVFGFIDLLVEPFILVPAQVALDYPVPYLLFGLGVGLFSGLYRRFTEASQLPLASALTVGALLVGGVWRLATHVLSGVLFFAEYAGDQNVWAYSIIYNISYLAPSLAASLLCALVIAPILARAVPLARPAASTSPGSGVSSQ